MHFTHARMIFGLQKSAPARSRVWPKSEATETDLKHRRGRTGLNAMWVLQSGFRVESLRSLGNVTSADDINLWLEFYAHSANPIIYQNLFQWLKHTMTEQTMSRECL